MICVPPLFVVVAQLHAEILPQSLYGLLRGVVSCKYRFLYVYIDTSFSHAPTLSRNIVVFSNQFGIGQRIPSKPEVSDEEHQKTKERVAESFQHMQRVWSEEKCSQVRHKCRNQHQE